MWLTFQFEVTRIVSAIYQLPTVWWVLWTPAEAVCSGRAHPLPFPQHWMLLGVPVAFPVCLPSPSGWERS